jgi:PTH2 family peptidyl-tRNA hydrolase
MATDFNVDDEPRMYMLVRTDIPGMTLSKALGQAGHAILNAWYKCFKTDPVRAETYVNHDGQGKVALRAKNLEVIEKAITKAEELGIPYYMVQDAGRTCIDPGTVTMLGLGPTTKREADPIVKRLQLLKDSDFLRVDNPESA